ncbi:hypothetical protein [Desertivirga arenae]|uniref:hypothetical protein n=1 Tax=Desertivirga arenae TaxID=2810309 RepID=UPI001A95C4B1|nr:hypothetical protein [Pedobacter sp. SYSU D00823]
MKTFPLTCVVLLFLLVSCKKSDFIASSTLTGKWQLVTSYYSTGGPLIYKDVDNDTKIYINFGKNGELDYSNSGYTRYMIKDSITITFLKNDQTTFDYYYKIYDGKLNLSPRTNMCIEGCGSIFRKVEE